MQQIHLQQIIMLIPHSSLKNIVLHKIKIRIGDLMVSVVASTAVDRGLEPRSGQTQDYKIDMCCFSAKHVALRTKGNALNGWGEIRNVSECCDMSIRGLLLQ
jgi:hypothetical protein